MIVPSRFFALLSFDEISTWQCCIRSVVCCILSLQELRIAWQTSALEMTCFKRFCMTLESPKWGRALEVFLRVFWGVLS